MDHSSDLVVAGRYQLDDSSLSLGPITAHLGHDNILDRRILLVDITAAAMDVSANHDVDIDLVLDAARRTALVADRRLVKLLDVGQSDETAYIVSEDPAGIPVCDIAAEHWSPQAVRALIGELAIALEAARSRGVHHLQLEPQLVHLTADGVRLFGLGYLAVLVTGKVVDGDEACAIDSSQLRKLGDSLLDPAQRDDDPSLRELLDGEDFRYLTPAAVAAALDPWDTHVLSDVWQAVSSPADSPDTPVSDEEPPADSLELLLPVVRTPSGSVFDEKSGTPTPPGTPPPASHTGIFGSFRGGSPRRVASGVSLSAGAADLLADVLPAASAGVPQPPPIPGGSAAGAAGIDGTASASGAAVSSASAANAPVIPPAMSPHSMDAQSAHSSAAGFSSSWPAQPATATSSSPQDDSGPLFVKDSSGWSMRINPTAAVLLFVVGLTLIASVWAFTSIGANLEPTHQVRSLRSTSTPQTPAASAASDDETDDTTSYAPPRIASGEQLDPDGDNNEHPEWVDRAFDGDQQTFWATRTYATPDFGGYDRRGIGYAITLEEKTLVSSVYLVTENTAGRYELRSTTADDPDGGTLLHRGSFSTDMEITLDTPVETDSLVLWVTELPESEDGYGIRLAEISLS